MSTPLLKVTHLDSWYGESHILHGVNFEIHEGELVTLLGRNGAGRSTTIKSILGLTGRRTGSVQLMVSKPLACKPTKWRVWAWAIAPKSVAFFQR